ncbi:Phosphate-binding protein PstS precursor [Lignipirellula cremea]|uniref:Phosphate-binding protein PstS n=2 Tax=Lignipirellula cremea TaxID=2528010 RepID=A0A518E0Q1_9BACT|nr:Phosphate-binding protein PstS precursor [Lignipirellula cremea]
MTTAQKAVWLLMCAPFLGVLAGCDKSSSDAGISITGAGSTFAAPLFDQWEEEYPRRNPGVKIIYDPVGSGDGESRFLAGKLAFGATDAGVPPEKLQENQGAIQFPITAGIIVLAYHADGLPPALKLPREVYVDVFLGKDVQWNDARLVR